MARLIDEYINSGMLYNSILPTSEYCAARLGLSESYFNYLLKFVTGKTLCKRQETARKMLEKPINTPATVARQLGYSNVQYFSLIFKKIIGVSPNEYRFLNN
ncbi:AraC family transcriptional regulator [Bacteroides sp.]|uniref:helix-turn-helix domain-containing protein n=1 Tax=Bacteroides sp. TaxID=29523 RepID=UPI0025856C2C|nr:AraC family transcriptional regulator [Bacteroides sp.]